MGRNVSIEVDEDGVVEENGPVALPAADPHVVDEDAGAHDKLPTHAVLNADGSVTLPLMFKRDLQIKKGGSVRTEPFATLVFHRLTGADQRAIASASEDMMSVVAFARSTRISQAVMNALFDKMDAADLNAGGQVLNSFLSSGRRTGR